VPLAASGKTCIQESIRGLRSPIGRSACPARTGPCIRPRP